MFTEKELKTIDIIIARLRLQVVETGWSCQGDEDIKVLEGVLEKMEIISNGGNDENYDN